MGRGHAFWIIAAGPHYFYFYFFPTETSGKLRGQEHLVFQSKPAPLPAPPPHTLLTLVTHNLSLLQGGNGAARDLLISQHAPLTFLTSFCHSLLLLLLDSQAPPESIHSDTHPHHHPPTHPPRVLSVVSTSQVSGLTDRRHFNRLERNRTSRSKASQGFWLGPRQESWPSSR